MTRDDYFRCPYCKGLYPDGDCQLDPVKGYTCPKGCVATFTQPPYESPLNEASESN